MLTSQRLLIIAMLDEFENALYRRVLAGQGNRKTLVKRELALRMRQSLIQHNDELTALETSVLLEALYDRLCADTLLDMREELSDNRVIILVALRVLVAQLFQDMGMWAVSPNLFRIAEDVELSHAEMVRMGLYELVPTEKIDGYAEGKGELSKIAKYLLRTN